MRLDQAARYYLGTPWLEGGRSRKGIDCVGLLVCCARDIGIPFDHEKDLNFSTHPAIVLQAGNKLVRRVILKDAAPGDVVVMMTKNVSYVGICSKPDPLTVMMTDRVAGVIEVPIPSMTVRGVFRPCHS